tara:strand:- start:106 stop:396 length:291 start_codon:yes stop_codon:yes gene_type:complete
MKKNVDGVEIEMTAEEIAARQAEEKASQAKQPEKRIARLRERRNVLLAETDWTQNRDVTLSNDADWKTYRQALRDITTQTPEDMALSNITFPTKPS